MPIYCPSVEAFEYTTVFPDQTILSLPHKASDIWITVSRCGKSRPAIVPSTDTRSASSLTLCLASLCFVQKTKGVLGRDCFTLFVWLCGLGSHSRVEALIEGPRNCRIKTAPPGNMLESIFLDTESPRRQAHQLQPQKMLN